MTEKGIQKIEGMVLRSAHNYRQNTKKKTINYLRTSET